MILELDCGNSLIKWRALSLALESWLRKGLEFVDRAVERAHQFGLVANIKSQIGQCPQRSGNRRNLLAYIGRARCWGAARCALEGAWRGSQWLSRVRASRDGSLVGYGWRFSVKAQCDACGGLGTAVTADLVDENGLHLGGYICPGLSLLRSQLHTHTQRIRYSMEALSSCDALELGALQVKQ